MRITIAAVGSTGDVLPYLGLGSYLGARGHDVTVATHRSFATAVTDAGLRHASVPMEPRESATEEFARRLRGGPRRAAAAVQDMFAPWVRDIALAIDAACDGADHVLLSAMAWTGVHSADARCLPSMGVHLQPLEPTGAFVPPVLGSRSAGAAVNRRLGRRAQAAMVRPYMAAHHAGAGTTAAVLRAGIPSVPVPVTLDQPFWAARLHRLGAATRPVHARRLTREALAAAVTEALSSTVMRRRAAEISARIGDDRGAAAVAQTLSASYW